MPLKELKLQESISMLPLAHIPVQPSSQDCLAWSIDGELAVAAGEEVYLLIPQTGSAETWTHVRITVSNFTTEEWSLQEPASFREMSIGEEQARATVTALSWSPPGLAKHRRSVLAVLTSNLILSLWASDSNPLDSSSWKRVLVFNKALSSRSRLQKRIRSMAWAPTNPQHVDRRTPFSRRKWGIPLIAIGDDSNRFYILRISSPFTGHSFEWDSEVLRCDDIPVPKSSNDRPSLFRLAMNASHFIDRIGFGTWDGGIPVVYRTSGISHHAMVSISEDPPSLTQPKDSSDRESLTVIMDEARPEDANTRSPIIVTPRIKARMATEKKRYGVANNIGNDVMVRTWGLASLDNLLAVCITLHPAKMIEYIAPFEGSATILFDAGNDDDNAVSAFPWQNPTNGNVAKTQGSILNTILDRDLQRPLALNNLDLKIIYTALCGRLLLIDDERSLRLEDVVNVLSLLERHASLDLLAKHRALAIQGSPQLSDQELIEIIRQMTKARGQAESCSGNPEMALLDLCPFCPGGQQIIPFDSFTEAQCPQKHPFGKLCSTLFTHLDLSYKPAARCALTFLPLLEPGISKRCFNCKREYLDERSHPEIRMRLSERLGPISISDSNIENTGAAQEDSGRVKHSLASVLFDKFDICPYCGGKFCD